MELKRSATLAWIAGAIILVGMFAKSFLFREGEPVILHYALTSFCVALTAIYAVLSTRRLVVDPVVASLLIFAIIWAFFSAMASGIGLNLVAVVTFAVLAVGYGIFLPNLLFWSGKEGWEVISLLLSVGAVFSALFFLLAPDLAIDPDSGRLAGVYVSVAVSCTMLGFAAVLALRQSLVSKTAWVAIFWFSIFFASAVMVYLTKTRSSFAEMAVAIFLIMQFSPSSRGLKMIISSLSAIAALAMLASILTISTGIASIDEQLTEFRLDDGSIIDSRNNNWSFGLERLAAKPLFGEGLLAKQTQGGTSGIDFDSKSSYNVSYDPHSLILSLGVQGGYPFLIAMCALMLWIPYRFVRVFGVSAALQSPEFILVSLRLLISIVAGGDMTALGNLVDKLCWLFLGLMAIKSELKVRQSQAVTGSRRSFLAKPYVRMTEVNVLDCVDKRLYP